MANIFGGVILEFKANSGVWGTMFGIPCIVADNFLKLATGEQLKVLLYILRCSGKALTAGEISANTGVPADSVNDAIAFWQQVNVLSGESPVQQSSIMTPPMPPVQPAPVKAAEPVTIEETIIESPAQAVPRQRQEMTPSQISGMLSESADLAELFKVAELTVGSLNHTMQRTLIWLFTYLGLKKEVIIVLIGYCSSIGKASPNYIEKVACSWAEKGLNTFSEAEAEVKRLSSLHDYTFKVMSAFEMKRNPTTKQQEIIDIWRSKGIDTEMLHYAYEKTIEQINKLSFEYINKIIISWTDSGFRTLADVKAAESEYRKKKKPSQSNSSSSDGDFDEDKYKFVINNF